MITGCFPFDSSTHCLAKVSFSRLLFPHFVQRLESMCELRRSAVIHLPHQECAREITNMSSAEMRWNACHRIQLLAYPGLRYADVTICRCLFAIVVPNRGAATAGTKLAFLPRRTQPVRAGSLNFTLPSLLIAFITI